MKVLRRVPFGWKAKAAAFRLFDMVPGGQRLHYLTQRHVTRSIPRDLRRDRHWQIEHARAFRQHFSGELRDATLFEFGAGWDLHSSFVQWCYGINSQIVVDISHLARLELVNRTIEHLRDNPLPEAGRIPERLLTEPLETSLETSYGIRYQAPADAASTGLANGSVELACTTSVLEHIPRVALETITRECFRICRPGAVLSHVIDYTDHFAHTDASLTAYNFLRFSTREWERYNGGLHFQNRLRHFEYGEIFTSAGFRVAGEIVRRPADAGEQLAKVPLAECFRGISTELLTPQTAHWILCKD